MKFRVPISFAIFIGSYLPLSIILLAQNVDYSHFSKYHGLDWEQLRCLGFPPIQNSVFVLSFVLVSTVCVAFTLVILHATKSKRDIVIQEVKHVPSELMNYVLPYVVSFMSFDYQDTGEFFGLTIFLLWIFWITHKSGQVLMNPVLIVFGWHLYDISYRHVGDEKSFKKLALAKGVEPTPNSKLKYASVGTIILLKSIPE